MVSGFFAAIERSISRFNFYPFNFSVSDRIRKYWRDIAIVLALAIVGGLASYVGAQLINSVILDEPTINVWFEADLPRVFANLTSRESNHYRTNVHPLFSLIAFPPVYILKTLGLDAIASVRIVIATVASLWISTLFTLLRLMSCRRFDATLFTILGGTSAAAMFWFVVPETYSFGSLTILLALAFVVLTQNYQFSSLWYGVVSAITLSMTVTNWMVGLLATIVNHRWKQSLQISANALCLVTVLWGIQKFIFPSALFFIGDREEKKYILKPESGGPLQVVKSFISHTMVMPAIELFDNTKRPDWPRMLTQASHPGSGSFWGAVAVGLWIALIGLGLWALFSVKQHSKLRIVLGLTLLGQLLLHAVYGDETFLYSLHFAPLLVVLAALSTLTRTRRLGLILAGMLLLSAGINNGLQFNQATMYFSDRGTPRHQVQAQMYLRPSDPWPRSRGHVVLAKPGTREEDKAYHEPGGSFSPSVGSFGVSIWIVDRQGNLKTTSDTIPLDRIRQQFVDADKQDIPGILTETSDYRALWSAVEPQRWQLTFQPIADRDTKPTIAIRSVGPAGGEIRSLDWDGERLLINDRWSVKLDRSPTAVYLGEESSPNWMSERSATSHWESKTGWGYARIELGDRKDWTLTLEDFVAKPKVELRIANIKPAIDLDLPDRQFTDSLNAQVAHLMMGLVGTQTRPGEPTNYPLSWQRDGAYQVVALARSGQIEVAKQLSTYFAENDFFGGFGPEADAPGLSIWALEEVAQQLNDSKYDRWLWPHVRRKAEFILKMLTTDRPIYEAAIPPILPSMMEKTHSEVSLVADPAQDGLIVGRMDHHRPLLFVNAVSYRGLLDAASLADRVDRPADARRWRAQAAQLQQAWENAFIPPESDNDRTYISSLWPTWVATSKKDALLQGLKQRWTQQRDRQGAFLTTPLWTYFDIAEAHQWLFLGQSNPVWTTLQWFWNHQASPGLYTWWEGAGEENTSGRWEQVRGWIDPPHVTPHYWTASEMLLLQLDMLAYLDRSDSEPTLVLGAGIPEQWRDRPMKVKGLSIQGKPVSWYWDGQKMQVEIRGSKINVKLGSVFPSNTPVNIKYIESE